MYSNILQIYIISNKLEKIYSYIASPFFAITIICCIYIPNPQYAFIIIVSYNLIICYKKKTGGKQKYIYRFFFKVNLPLLVAFISSCGFQLPSAVISLLQYGLIPTLIHYVFIITYLTLVHVIDPQIQSNIHNFTQFFYHDVIDISSNSPLVTETCNHHH